MALFQQHSLRYDVKALFDSFLSEMKFVVLKRKMPKENSIKQMIPMGLFTNGICNSFSDSKLFEGKFNLNWNSLMNNPP